ncbi:MAG: DUF2250 domain-containing protein [candidate division Zixibacteria bacterium]|nr:DUF2250 domain-containing protein [candidate division Zixibacteria bacterium]
MADKTSSSPLLKERYVLAKCCSPSETDQITGYFSYDNLIKVHRHDCANLIKAEPDRLVQLVWKEILATHKFRPGTDYTDLDATDFAILKHHRDYDIDYSLKVAQVLGLEKQETFDRHRKLRELGLLERVETLIVQYRKKIAKNKWIKHRNHTYYKLTERGIAYLNFYLAENIPNIESDTNRE